MFPSIRVATLVVVVGFPVTSNSTMGGQTQTCNCTLFEDTDFHGYDLVPAIHNVTTAEACCELCVRTDACRFFSWMNEPALGYANHCSLKRSGADARAGQMPPPSPMGVFFRVPWASEVPVEQLDSWFQLIARGRAEGPTSPYYVSELGLQQVASGQWPPINKDKPGVLFKTELELIAKYFPLFNRVYIGTLLLPGKNYSNASYWVEYGAMQHKVASEFLQLYPVASHPNFAWYITEEGCLDDPVSLTRLVQLSAPALHSVAPLSILWSPGFCRRFASLPGTPAGSVLEAELETMFCNSNMTIPIAIHFQDLCGQTSTFQFPFTYDYTNAMNSSDGVSYYNMLQRVSAKCPILREVKINMEMFIEHRNPQGQGGEDNGAFILDGDPYEVGTRKQVYNTEAEIGVSWALPHWFNLNTYANRTMGFQCTEAEIKNNTCTHPYRSVHVSELSTRSKLLMRRD